MKITYQYFSDSHILFIKWDGLFVLNEYLKSIEQMKNMYFWNESIKVFMDLRSLILGKIDDNNYSTMKKLEGVNQTEKFPPFLLAYLASEPKIIALLHLYIEDERKQNHAIFSTLNAAKNFLNIPLTPPQIESILANLTEISL